ncbi:MAG: DHHW family protein [Schaedlerella sp.]|nr:DHHW family protein [Schaedlerella sp.]
MTKEFKKRNRKSQKKYLQLTICIFISVLLVGFLWGFLFPLRPTESDLEKRELTKFPTPTVVTVLNGEFFSGVSTWYADTFPFRESLINMNSSFKTLYGIKGEELYGNAVAADEIPDADAEIKEKPKDEEENLPDATIHDEPEQAGTIYIAGNRGFGLYGFSLEGADAYINMINTAADLLEDDAAVYCILAPTSIAVNLDEEKQAEIGSSNQGDAFDYIYGHLDSSVKKVPILETLKKHNSEYLYFYTDHHWTADGAYYAYKELMKAKGEKASPLSEYEKNEYEGFIGTFYSYSQMSETLKNNPDTVVTYTPECNDMIFMDENNQEVEWQVVADPTDYSEGSKYMCFIGGDRSYSVIENPNIDDGSSCVVIKESYGNAFVPFLVNSYQTVHVVDYRHYTGNLVSFVKSNNVQDVIFLNNCNAIAPGSASAMYQMLVR